MDKKKLILAMFNKLKDKSEIRVAMNELNNDKNLKDMVDSDPVFKSQLQNANSDTIHAINKHFNDIDEKYM